MARKTITTREAPMKQLLRELDIIQSTAHPNIILFYGAYMSPSSSEVKILMEYCPGKSLEAIGKRVADRNGRVGEKVAGRLAEGVSQIFYPPFTNHSPSPGRSYKASRTSTPKRPSTETSNPPTSFSLAKASSSSATLAFQASSSIPGPVPSRGQVSTWPLVPIV
jgi:hypothetical protein